MAKGALGLIEVKGYLGAVVAADAAVKAANVSLLNIESVKAGLRTVQLTGDVAAVKAAVDAAVQTIQDKPYYLASHVIPRLDEQTEKILQPRKKIVKDSIVQDIEENEETTIGTVASESIDVISKQENLVEELPLKKYKREELEQLKVVELRKLAYREDQIELKKKEIKFGNKVTLVNALIKLERKE